MKNKNTQPSGNTSSSIKKMLSKQQELPAFVKMGVSKADASMGVTIYISKSKYYNNSVQFRTLKFYKPISKF